MCLSPLFLCPVCITLHMLRKSFVLLLSFRKQKADITKELSQIIYRNKSFLTINPDLMNYVQAIQGKGHLIKSSFYATVLSDTEDLDRV